MQQLTAGANLVLAQPQCQIKIKTALPAHIDLDVSAYLLNAQNKVRGDADMIFYGQKHGQDFGQKWDLNHGAKNTLQAIG